MPNGGFKIGQRVVFTQAGNEALATQGRAAIMQGATLHGPKAGTQYAVGTVMDATGTSVKVAVDGLSGEGELFTLDSWYAACPACVRENVELPLPPTRGNLCEVHAKAKKTNDNKGGSEPATETNTSEREKTMVKKGNGKQAKAAKAPKEKKEAAGRKSAWPEDAKISVLVKENPKREGAKGHKQFVELMKCDGKPVAEFLALEGHRSAFDGVKGWPAAELRYCVAKKFIKIT